MALPIIEAHSLVRIDFDANPDVTFPAIPSDVDGHAWAFSMWCIKERVYSVRGGGSGGGRFVRYFYAEDAVRVVAWWEERLGREIELFTGWVLPDGDERS